MGLLGNVLGASQVNNGMNGPLSSFMKGFSSNNSPDLGQPARRYNPDSRYEQQEMRQRDMQLQLMQQQDLQQRGSGRRDRRRDGRRDGGRDDRRDRRQNRQSSGYASNNPRDNIDILDGRPPYATQTSSYTPPNTQSQSAAYEQPVLRFDYPREERSYRLYPIQSLPDGESSGFRPLALPQITYGEGKPFLRAYSDELSQYKISEGEFIKVVDSLNKAIIPNPENQIFQKTAQTAGYFIPGAESIALTASRVVVGMASSMGHGTILAKTLSKANLQLFIPHGLEICIGKAQNVDEEAGYTPSLRGFQGDTDPEIRLDQYGEYLMPISVVYPEQQKIGRQDPIAMWVKHTSARDAQKSMQRASKERDRGRRTKKGDSLEGDLQWLIVRKASADAVAQWEKTLQQSAASLAEERRPEGK